MKAMILAAGRGERMRPLTDSIPKPLLKVGEYSLIEHLLYSLKQHGFENIVINHAHLGKQVEDTLGNGSRYGVSIQYSAEGETGLETGGDIFKALPLLDDRPFLVVNGDIWTDYPFSQLHNQPGESMAHLVLVDNPDHNQGGDFALGEHGLAVNEGDRRYTFSGIGVYRPEIFNHCQAGKFPLAPMLRELAGNGQLSAELFRGDWSDVGTVERLHLIRNRLDKSG